MSAGRIKLFIESIPLIAERPSGIGYALLGLVTELANDPDIQKDYEVVLVVPKRGLHKLDRWPALKNCTRRGLPLRMRIIQGLMRVHLLPPMDLFLGRGVYIFGNFMNWKVTKRSYSLTYIHDIAFKLYPQFVSPKLQRMLAAKVPGFIKQTDCVITVSESSKREIHEAFGVPDERLLVLPNGVDTSLFKPYKTVDIEVVKARYDITQPYYIFVSSVEPRKNVIGLVRAFMTLPKDRSLVMIGGSGWLNEDALKLIAEARTQGAQIIWPETYVPSEDVAPLIGGADALVHPAFHEGFGMTPLEAMACGTPVVVVDIPALREVVGDCGMYCDPASVESIADGMRRVVALSAAERARFIDAGKERAQHFTWRASAHKLADFLAIHGPQHKEGGR